MPFNNHNNNHNDSYSLTLLTTPITNSCRRLALALSLLVLLLISLPPTTASPARRPVSARSAKCPVQLDPHPPLSRAQSSAAAAAAEEEAWRGKLREVTTNAGPLRSVRAGDPRIVNGDLSSGDLGSYLAVLANAQGAGGCTGTVVGPRLVVTAAHCEGYAYAFVGSSFGALGTRVVVDVWISDVKYDHGDPDVAPRNNYWYDFAFAVLAEDVPDGVKFMAVSINASVPADATWARAAGFGTLMQGTNSNTDLRLYQVDMPIYDSRACAQTYERSLPVDMNMDRQVCAGYHEGGCDSCQGDSGGPLLQYDHDGNPVLVAVVSFGSGCALPGFPGVYVRTAQYESELRGEGLTLVERVNDVTAPVQKPPNSPIVIIAAAAGAVLLLLTVVGLCVWFCVRRRKERPIPIATHPATSQGPVLYPPPPQPVYQPQPQPQVPYQQAGLSPAPPIMHPPQYAFTQQPVPGGMGNVPPPAPPVGTGMGMGMGMGMGTGLGVRPTQQPTVYSAMPAPLTRPPPPPPPPPPPAASLGMGETPPVSMVSAPASAALR